MAHTADAHADHAAHGHGDGHHDDHHHHELGFWKKYVFSTDHKVIGIQYGISGLVFLMFGFMLMMLMRWSIAHGAAPIAPNFPMLGEFLNAFFGDNVFAKVEGGFKLTPEGYNVFGAMHGTIMVFFGIVPAAFASFGNYVMPLQIGAVDMCFPRLNMASYWCFFVSCILMMSSFWLDGGAAKSGWTAYPPLSVYADSELSNSAKEFHKIINGGTMWIIAMVFNITASLLGSINFIATVVQLRAPGMTWMRLPFFTWAIFITAYLLLLAFPPLEAAAVMQLMDRVFDSSLFMPTGLNFTSGGTDHPYSGGGSPILWQHLFWFLAHPEVYVLILPALGMVTEIIANNTRKPIYGYKLMIGALFSLAILSFIVWAHHMYMTGMGAKVAAFFQTTTILISVPSVILLTCIMLSMWGGSIRFNSASLFAITFIPMFGIGGLTGIPLAFNAVVHYLHDTYYVIAHFHYVVAPGTIFAIFAGTYYWFPKATGRMMNEFLGKLHWIGSLVFINGVFFPMFLQGMMGVHRRWYDGGAEAYKATVGEVLHWNQFTSTAAWMLGLAQIPFIVNFIYSIFWGRKVTSDNPWQATTLEWDTPTPPPHGNFTKPIAAYRGPYEYSVPGAPTDFTPQSEAPEGAPFPVIPGETSAKPAHAH